MDLVVEQGHGKSCRILKSDANFKWGFGVPDFRRNSCILSLLQRLYKKELFKGLDSTRSNEHNFLNITEFMLQ
jgi:hypothetical protein